MTMAEIARRAFAVVGACGIAALLAGCGALLENQARGPIALSRGEAGLEVVVCTDAEAVEVYMEVRHRGEPWRTYWSAEGAMSFAAGDNVFDAAGSAGLGGARPDEIPESGQDFLVQMVGPTKPNTAPQAAFAVPSEGIPRGGWLQASGEITAVPCPDA